MHGKVNNIVLKQKKPFGSISDTEMKLADIGIKLQRGRINDNFDVN